MKKLMILAGSQYVIPVIEAAHRLGCHVITVDYLPDNTAHALSDEYHNVSTIDKDAVLELASNLDIDGIMSFSSDAGVLTAAFVAEKLGLPYQGPFDAIAVLQNKRLFRAFLRDNGFNCPEFHTFTSTEAASVSARDISYPVIVKPVDSAGSKGCTRVDAPSGLAQAVEDALSFSVTGTCIAEQFLEQRGSSSDADAFLINGSFRCISYTAQLFDDNAPNPYAPAGYMMPADMPAWAQQELHGELQRLADLLGLTGSGAFNIETRVCTDGKPYIMEMAPRGGGNRLCEMLRFATGIDLITASVKAALGLEVSVSDVHPPEYDGIWYQQMLHVNEPGIFEGLKIDPVFAEKHVIDQQIWVKPGGEARPFTSGNFALGSVMMRFDDRMQADRHIAHLDTFLKAELR